MKKSLSIYAALLSIFVSCSKGEISMDIPGNFMNINGLVVDEDSVPVNHIKVTAEWESDESPMEAYTSSKGVFSMDLHIKDMELPLMVTLTFTDIDGEDNGGMFSQTVSKVVIRDKNFLAGGMQDVPTYRLNHATVSENIPQSL